MTTSLRNLLWCAMLVGLACVPSIGCGSTGEATVNGTLLRHDGSPLVGARVIARSENDGHWAAGTSDQKGYFELEGGSGDGLMAGSYYVIIVEDRGSLDDRRSPTIAPKYEKPSSSGITLSLMPGETRELNVKLEAP